ncbi:hypothetical protein PCANC_18907 [Puccinia coronata f. sp. avenae]|uniref:Zn(2)-C6 fungal-type domain-containing protein n=1 Tax=Puccinia coronata f. sp. avenae TaxID=200324 RepID=A0A2N5SNH4_9BASI|nr:hypothetical protein PCANC_18907 [Puccinia coronata f. sp. avenae]
MPSSSHSGQIRNSTSPSVVALNSAKAPSAAAAKPRFRSRTGCWTCRRRKVKCDERGRNPETVAYGGPLSTSAGCKRCEDSGRPCRGYGAQAPTPSGPVINQYPSGNLQADHLIRSAPFYSFSSHAHHDPVNPSASYSAATGSAEAAPCPVPHSIQWSQSFEQHLTGSQSISCGLQMSHNGAPSSGPTSTSVGGASVAPLHTPSVHLPSVELRRYSVPSYPTWQRSSQSRDNDQYSSGGLVGNHLFQPSTQYEKLETEVHPLATRTSCVSERLQSFSHPNDCTVLPTDPYHNLSSNDLQPHYNHDLNEHEAKHLPFDFGRPHTSSGISSSFNDHQSLHSNPNAYHSPINPNAQVLESIGEAERQYPDLASAVPSMTVSSDVASNVWSENPSGPASLLAFRPTTSTNNNHCVVSAPHNPLLPSQMNDALNYHTRDGFQNVGATDIPIFHDIPYDVYAGHHSLQSKSGSAEEGESKSTNESAEQSFHGVKMEPSCHQTLAEMITRDAHENLRADCSYIKPCALPIPTESEKDQIPPRKGSSSSSSSSLSTQEHNVSPVATSIQNSLPGMSDKWSASCFLPSLQTHHYDFQSILHHNTSDCQTIGNYEDDSPTSTAPSNMSGAAGGN